MAHSVREHDSLNDTLKIKIEKTINLARKEIKSLDNEKKSLVSHIQDNPNDPTIVDIDTRITEINKEIKKLKENINDQLEILSGIMIDNLHSTSGGSKAPTQDTRKWYASRFTSKFGFSPVYNPYYLPSNSDTNSYS